MGKQVRARAALATAVAIMAGALVAVGGAASAVEAGHGSALPVRNLAVYSTQDAPLDGEEFTLTVDADDLAWIRGTSSGEVTFRWAQDGDCSFLTVETGESLTAACPNPQGRGRLDRSFSLEIYDGDRLAGSGSISVMVTAPALTMWAGGIDKRSRFQGQLVARSASLDQYAHPDATVEIQEQVYGSSTWETLTTARTDAEGMFLVLTEVRHAGLVRAHFPGDDTVAELTSKPQRLQLQPKLTVRVVDGRTWLLTLKDPWGHPLAGQHVFLENSNGTLFGKVTKTDRRGRARIVLGFRPTFVVYATSYSTRTWAPARTAVRPG